jgi:hypothetical protein
MSKTSQSVVPNRNPSRTAGSRQTGTHQGGLPRSAGAYDGDEPVVLELPQQAAHLGLAPKE